MSTEVEKSTKIMSAILISLLVVAVVAGIIGFVTADSNSGSSSQQTQEDF
jgi:hypothetical protein